jgi:hypothetical protein
MFSYLLRLLGASAVTFTAGGMVFVASADFKSDFEKVMSTPAITVPAEADAGVCSAPAEQLVPSS